MHMFKVRLTLSWEDCYLAFARRMLTGDYYQLRSDSRVHLQVKLRIIIYTIHHSIACLKIASLHDVPDPMNPGQYIPTRARQYGLRPGMILVEVNFQAVENIPGLEIPV